MSEKAQNKAIAIMTSACNAMQCNPQVITYKCICGHSNGDHKGHPIESQLRGRGSPLPAQGHSQESWDSQVILVILVSSNYV